MWTPYMPGAHWGQKRVLFWMVVSHHMGTGNCRHLLRLYNCVELTKHKWETWTGLENKGQGTSKLCKLLPLKVGKAVKGFQLNPFKGGIYNYLETKCKGQSNILYASKCPQIRGVCLVEESMGTEKRELSLQKAQEA